MAADMETDSLVDFAQHVLQRWNEVDRCADSFSMWPASTHTAALFRSAATWKEKLQTLVPTFRFSWQQCGSDWVVQVQVVPNADTTIPSGAGSAIRQVADRAWERQQAVAQLEKERQHAYNLRREREHLEYQLDRIGSILRSCQRRDETVCLLQQQDPVLMAAHPEEIASRVPQLASMKVIEPLEASHAVLKAAFQFLITHGISANASRESVWLELTWRESNNA